MKQNAASGLYQPMSWTHIALVSCLLAGCVGDELELGETELAAKSNPGEGGDQCPPWACGSNSPVIDLAFHELSFNSNLANLQGYRMTGFQKFVGTWKQMTPSVVNGALIAFDASTGTTYTGAQLVGSAFTIVGTSGTIYLNVAAVSRTPLWAKIGTVTRFTNTYRFTVTSVLSGGQGGVNLCGANNENDGVADFFAVLFESDRIDADAIQVLPEDPRWFNIGCAGHALAKQHLTGNTKAAAALMGVTTPSLKQRTANLKMISGDYCGGGDPFTVAGVPLHYKDSLGRMDSTPGYTHIEARWDHTGAICLSTPRVDYTWTVLGKKTFPDGVEWLLDQALDPPPPGPGPHGQDKVWCTGLNGTKVRPPTCSDPSLSNFQGGYVISVEE